MKRRLGFTLSAGMLLSVLGMWWSCSELKEEQGPLDADQQLEVHPAGWVDIAHEGFHGKALAKGGWNFAQCQGCHGTDYKGGITDSSCLTCHAGGPQACTTCHGDFSEDVNKPFNWAPPKDMANHMETTFRGVGAHQMHVRFARLRGLLDCLECHFSPTKVEDPGHLDSDLPAEITFGELARSEGAEPLWDTERLQCSNVYCHGAFKYGNRDNAPIWTNVGIGQAACGTCHGLPPPSETGHPQSEPDECTLCHSNVVDESRNIKDRTLHINGKADFQAHPGGWVDVGHEEFHGKELAKTGWDLVECQQCHGTDYRGGITGSSCFVCHTSGPETCTTCHGNASGNVELAFNWAPPEDVDGQWETTFRGVGAHQAHVQYATLRMPPNCSECHLTPTRVEDPGHLDSDLPAEVPFGELARKEGAEPFWDAEGAQCNNVYCHGAFKFGNKDNAPIWTNVGAGQAACGTCHGLPPPAETGHVQMDKCSLCHGSVVDEDGNFEDRTLHVNGETDF